MRELQWKNWGGIIVLNARYLCDYTLRIQRFLCPTLQVTKPSFFQKNLLSVLGLLQGFAACCVEAGLGWAGSRALKSTTWPLRDGFQEGFSDRVCTYRAGAIPVSCWE